MGKLRTAKDTALYTYLSDVFLDILGHYHLSYYAYSRGSADHWGQFVSPLIEFRSGN